MTVRFELRGPLTEDGSSKDTYSLVLDGENAESVLKDLVTLAQNEAFSTLLNLAD